MDWGGKRGRLSWLLSGLVVFGGVTDCAARCLENGALPGLGPLTVRSQSPGQVLRLTPLARPPKVLAQGEHEFRAMGAVTSTYAKDEEYYLDLHTADLRFAVAMGLGQCWDLEVAVDQRSIVNAYLDDITLGVHRLLGFDDSGHDDADRNATEIHMPAYGVDLDEGDRGPFSRSVELTLTRLLNPRDARRPAISLALLARYQILDEEERTLDATDVGLGVNLGQRIGTHHAYLDLTYVWFGTNRYLGIPLKERQFSGMFAWEWRRGEDFSWLAQYLYSEGVVRNLGDLGEPAHEVHLGAKWRVGRSVVDAALIENIITYNNSTDFGFALAVSTPF